MMVAQRPTSLFGHKTHQAWSNAATRHGLHHVHQLRNVCQSRSLVCQVLGQNRPNSSTSASSTKQQASSAEDVNCISTGSSVQCSVDGGDESRGQRSASTSGQESPTPAVADAPLTSFEQLAATALLISPFFFWGSSMVVMKGVIPHTTPLFLGALRLLPAGAVLIAWAAANGRKQPMGFAAWAWVLAFAAVDGAGFQGFLAEGLQRTPAGLGSVIIDSQPLTVAVLAAVLFGERLSGAALVGLGLGVAGLLLLELPEEAVALAADSLQHPGSDGGGLMQALSMIQPASFVGSGEFYMLLAAQSMAVGTVMVRYVTKYVDPVMATGWHMLIGGAMLLAASVTQDADVLPERLAGFTTADAWSMLYVSLFGGAASYGIFFFNAAKGNLTALSSLTFLTPLFAAGGGYLLLDERLNGPQLLGAVVTLGAVFLINTKPNDDSNSKEVAEPPQY